MQRKHMELNWNLHLEISCFLFCALSNIIYKLFDRKFVFSYQKVWEFHFLRIPLQNNNNIYNPQNDMRQLILYVAFILSMVLGNYGKMSAAITSTQDCRTEDRVQKVEQKENHHEAQLDDASQLAYRICSSRPQRLLPNGNIQSCHGNHKTASRLLFNRTRFLSSLLATLSGGMETFRKETVPIRFDVASKYYVICLRHLRC